LARTAAAGLAGRGIRVNTVAPGPIVTPIFGGIGLPQEAIDEFAKEIIAKVPMKRFAQPEEVAGAVRFLASHDASYITGVEINVDGGLGQIGIGSAEQIEGGDTDLDCTPKVRHEIKGPITLNGGEQCLCPDKSIPGN
jgi:enoyl-[acyl-carrier-protein] reductase (NADH)